MSLMDADLSAVLASALDAFNQGDDGRVMELLSPFESLASPSVDALLGSVCFFSLGYESLSERQRGLDLLARAAKNGDGSMAHNYAMALSCAARSSAHSDATLEAEAARWSGIARQRGFPMTCSETPK